MEAASPETAGGRILALGGHEFADLLKSACGGSCSIDLCESIPNADAMLNVQQESFNAILAEAALLQDAPAALRAHVAGYSSKAPLILVRTDNAPDADALAAEFNASDVIQFSAADDAYSARLIRLTVRANVAERRNESLQETLDQLKQLSIKDALTGVYNVRYFWARFRYELLRAIRYEQSLSCLMLDLDRFKSVNDRYGHQVGDDLLHLLAETVSNGIREVDIIARYGGEEFAIILPNTSAQGAIQCAENIREKVSAVGLIIGENEVRTTVSIGVSVLTENIKDEAELLQQADSALNAAKHAGRNRALFWGDLASSS